MLILRYLLKYTLSGDNVNFMRFWGRREKNGISRKMYNISQNSSYMIVYMIYEMKLSADCKSFCAIWMSKKN